MRPSLFTARARRGRLTAASLRALPVAAGALLLAACASMGRPEGGPRDMQPPVFVRSSPAPGELNVASPKVSLWFDENLRLDDPSNKVIVSPAQSQQPLVSANARRIRVELRDTLLPNTTYTIDFGDAIQDLNENNPLDGFALAFSTGPEIDSLSISGMVVEGRTLEPAQGMLVGVHREPLADTTLTHTPFERVTRTNQLGQFTLRNLAEGSYRVFAVNDVNRDNRWDRSEDLAFFPAAVTPWARTVAVTDTVAADSVAGRTVTEFGPSDLLLEWFNEDYRARYLAKHERPERRRLELMFGAPADSLPRLSLLAPDSSLVGRLTAPRAVTTANAGIDTLSVWLTDSALILADTLRIAVDYQHTDSLDAMSWTTDTLLFIYREPRKSKSELRREQEEAERAARQAEEDYARRKALADSLGLDSVPPAPRPAPERFKIGCQGSGTQEVGRDILFTSPTPIDTFRFATGVRLELAVDTLWEALPLPRLVRPDSLDSRSFAISYDWEPGEKYRLTIDSLAVTDIFGLDNAQLSHEFGVRDREEYSSLFFRIEGLEPGQAAVVELLSSGDNPVREAAVDSLTHTATLEFLNPGTFYARLYADANRNGRWDAGHASGLPPDSLLTPEPTSYYPKKIVLKKNWDVELTWDINATAVDLQKPEEIKKNKPRRNKWDESDPALKKDGTDADDEDNYYDDGRGGFDAAPYGANKY